MTLPSPMPDVLEIASCPRPVDGTMRPPGSKSITNRALVCAALAHGDSLLMDVLDSDDTRVMASGLSALGFSLSPDWQRGEIRVSGSAGVVPAGQAEIDCRASGTTMRFLAAVCGLGRGRFRLDGTPRMRQRPIGDLVGPLRDLGIDARAESPGECPPVSIHSPGATGGAVTVRGSVSSQFASGLALAAACMPTGLRLQFEGTLVSTPYLDMTRQVMKAFGATVEVAPDGGWWIPPTGYTACRFAVEPDASAASYFFAAAAITGGSVTVPGLSRRSLQGDVAFCAALERMGCSVTWHDDADRPAITVSGRAARGIDIDMNAISDTVPTLAVTALFAQGPTTIRNVAHVRDKETDRLGDLARELRRLGAVIEERQDGLTIVPAPLHPATVATYDDHRMAMSLALAGLRVPGVRVADPACVGKTFPRYWEALAALTAPHPPHG